MFVRSRMEKDAIYRRKGEVWVIKAGSVTSIDENKVTARELKSLYGSRIEIISRDKLEDEEVKIPIKKEIKNIENKEVKVEPNKKPLDEFLIKDILTEIKDEIPVKKEEVKVEIIDPIKEAFMTGVGSELVPQKQEENKLKVTKDEIGDLVLEPVHAGADLKIELDAVQPAEVKKEESVVETGKEIPVLKEGEKGEQKAPVLEKSKKSSRKGPGKRARAKRVNANK